MRHLREDIYSRRSGSSVSSAPARPGGLLFVLMFASAALLVLSRINHVAVQQLRQQIAEFAAPALSAAMVPVQPVRRLGRQVSAHFELFKELQRLRDENQSLKGWEWRAKELERRMAALSSLARVVREPALKFVTGRVVADASGPFVRIALIDAGRNHGIKRGNPVINGDGLVGRIVNSGRAASRLLLLSDLNSRVPVMVGPAGVRALMLGDNSPVPQLDFLARGDKVEAGDEVYTSGVGGLLPRGLRIGKVAPSGGKLQVKLNAQLDRLEYVSVLLFETPALELSGDGRMQQTRGRMTPRMRARAKAAARAGKSRSGTTGAGQDKR